MQCVDTLYYGFWYVVPSKKSINLDPIISKNDGSTFGLINYTWLIARQLSPVLK
jgi:hypothetical protein